MKLSIVGVMMKKPKRNVRLHQNHLRITLSKIPIEEINVEM